MRRKVWVVIGAAVLVLAGVALALHLTRDHIDVAAAGGERVRLDRVDHAPFDALLQKYVDDQGLVAYRRWHDDAADRQALQSYLGRLGAVDLQAEVPRDVRLAYWINAYNALTLEFILRKYPLGSIKEYESFVPGKFRVWRDVRLEVDGKPYSLDDIEHGILRKMGEPRIHFALVCASRGCPPLRNRAYAAAGLDAQLADNARRFFARPGNFAVDADDHAVRLSQLLGWYGGDFADKPADRVRALRDYFPQKPDWLGAPDLLVSFDLKYDWSLNDQHPEKGWED